MGKTKKGKKDVVDEENTKTVLGVEDDIDPGAQSKASTKDKKGANKVKAKPATSESENEVADAPAKKVAKETGKKAAKGKKKKRDSDDESDGVVDTAKKGGFNLLMGSDDEDSDFQLPTPEPEPEDDDDDIVSAKQAQPKLSKKKSQVDAVESAANKKNKQSKKKRNDTDEDDIDKMLAELALDNAADKPAPKERKASDADAGEGDGDAVNDNGSTVKSAAQKKKEKKERQKREAALLKQQQTAVGDENVVNESAVPVAAAPAKKDKSKKKEAIVPETSEETVTVGAEGAEEAEAGAEDAAVDKKKKKKKTKEEKKEEEKENLKKKKGPSQAMVAAMQERLLKIKEEEERQKLEEEARIRREEEIERLRLEQIRLEAERKEKKKQKDQERKARLKAEGKLLTPKQKLEQARAQAMLESLRAQGVELPEVGAKKPRPGTRIRPNKKKDQQAAAEEKANEAQLAAEEAKGEQEPVPETPAPVVEKVKDSWDASSSEDESEEPEPPKTASTATGPAVESQKSVEKTESGEESDSDSREGSDESDDSEDEDDADTGKTDAEIKKEKAWERIMKRRHAAEQKRTVDNLRAAVVCVLGHVDTGKTKILDKLRRTHVQDGEAGGITQQIGATNVPIDAIKEQCKIVKGSSEMVYRLPGLLIIDTPGHESFSNLRNRGSSLCDIAILVVDIMHGLEPQTIESINILKSRKTPFIVALNKIDRLYDWLTVNRKDVRDVLKSQSSNVIMEFEKRTKEVILQFAEQGLNAALFYENPDPRSYVNLVPTSAITGEGMGNLLYLIIESCQSWLAKRLMYSEELLATVLEVKAIPGLGTTIDAILINGKLREGQTMVVAGTDGPITTQIRSLLMPQPMKELRVKNAYIEYKEVIGAQGVKIAAKELEKAIAGLNLYVANKPDEVEICREEVAKELRSALSHIKLSSEGVYVQASTLGSLEALLEFLKTSKIPYANIRIGPVVKRDVMKASIMLEHEPTYATILAFDVKVERDAQELADSLGVRIFQADIIYHLFDNFEKYRKELKEKKREEFRSIAVFPCKLKILPQYIFNSRDPIVVGVIVEAGIVKEGTPICVPSQEFLDIGIVTSVEINHKKEEFARKGQEVCIKIEPIPGESPKMFGRHFDEKDMLVSKISRQSIDACKDYFRDDLLKADWALMVELKKLFQIL